MANQTTGAEKLVPYTIRLPSDLNAEIGNNAKGLGVSKKEYLIRIIQFAFWITDEIAKTPGAELVIRDGLKEKSFPSYIIASNR